MSKVDVGGPAIQRRSTGVEDDGSQDGKISNPLESFCVDLTQRAREGKIDPMIGRVDELERMIQVLSRRRKNNPLLIGEPGVGKTALAEGLALRIVEKVVPESLLECTVYSLDMTAVLAGTRYRGDFEERLKAVMKVLIADPKSILFIDEIHNIIGAGATSRQVLMDAANILKPPPHPERRAALHPARLRSETIARRSSAIARWRGGSSGSMSANRASRRRSRS